MATINLVIKTNASQLTAVLIKDMGVTIAATGGSETFVEVEEVRIAARSQELKALVVDNAHGAGSSTLILNDGTSDIAQADALNFLLSLDIADGGENFGVIRTDSAGTVDQSMSFSGGATVTNFTAGGDVNLNSNKITNLATPTAAADAVTKAYADSLLTTGKWKTPVRVLSDADLTLSGLQTVDGVSLSAGDRILLTAQAPGSENGIWVVDSGAWTRPTDFATGDGAASAVCLVEQGTVYADQQWTCTNDTGTDVIDTDALTWVKISQAGAKDRKLLQFGHTVAVPQGGSLFLRSAGPVFSSAAATLMMRDGNISAGSISVDAGDATHAYKLSIKINGVEVELVSLPTSTTAAYSNTLSAAYSAGDLLSVSVEKVTAGSHKSDFKEITATIEIQE